MSQLFCLGDLKFSSSSDNFLGSEANGKVFKGTLKEESVAIKKLSPNCADISKDGQQWEKLIKLQDENLVSYHQCKVQANVRYLVMELCQGSLLDYCRKTLDESVASHVKATDIMWQIICAIDYLHCHKIDHGDLKLENVLFWKRDSKSRRVVVKLTGYGYNYPQCEGKIDINRQLGCLFYSAASKNHTKPKQPVFPSSLTEIDDDDHKSLASHLIDFLINPEYSNRLQVGTLLKHPLFTRCSEDARTRLKSDEMFTLIWKDELKLLQWKNYYLDEWETTSPGENFDDLKDIFHSFNDTAKIVNEANTITPQLFSEYVWHIALSGNNKSRSIEIQKELGKGNYGKVYKCKYTDGNGKTYPAACKKCNTKSEAEDVFIREIETLRKLDHLFVVKYYDVVEKDFKKFIVMELCDGSLKDYVEGKLEGIPKDSLDVKILIGQVAFGLVYIHSEGIIHKDLKLENILLKRQSPRLVLAKIADFGFAKELKPGKSEFSETAHPGTEDYMAPELLNAKVGAYPATFASDVYSLGITIARIVLKGEHPFSTNVICRKVSMIKGLVPQNLQGFSWDLIDLILKLTDQDPGKRPEMILVLLHPYFALTNDKTKRHFVDQIWANLTLFPDEMKAKQIKTVFSKRNFQEWYETISNVRPETTEEIKKMVETFQLFRTLRPDIQADTLYPGKQYEKTIKEAMKSEHDTNVENKINQMVFKIEGFFMHGLSRYRLHKLIQRAPKLFIPYLWSHILGIISPEKPLAKSVISELEWSSLYHYDEEVVDELWNIKYSENYENSPETFQEITETMAKCNVSVKVWAALLNRVSNIHGAATLALSAVQSCASNALKVTEMILQKYGITEEMVTLIHMAATNTGHWGAEIMKEVLKYGGNPNATNLEGWTPVHYAARNESRSAPKIMKLILDHEGDPNAQISMNLWQVEVQMDYVTPVHFAASNQGDHAAEILKLLIDGGGACDAAVEINNIFLEPIQSATMNIDESAFGALELFDSGGTCDAVAETNNIFFKPIHSAAMNIGESALELVDLLLNKRDPTNKSSTVFSLVYCVMSNLGDCGPKIMKKLLENGENPNVCDEGKQTPLHFAAENEEYLNIETMKVLLENGGDPNAPDKMGRTPVHLAAVNQGEQAQEKLKLLLNHGGKLDVKNKMGFTPVHYAAHSVSKTGPEQMKILLENGGDANASDKDGYTPLHFVVNNPGIHGPELTRMLLEYGGNPNMITDLYKLTSLRVAIENENDQLRLDIIKQLLEKGGNPNAEDKERSTPVHYIIVDRRRNSLKVLKLLLEHGGNIFQKNNFGVTPYRLATQMGNEQYCHPKINKHIANTYRKK